MTSLPDSRTHRLWARVRSPLFPRRRVGYRWFGLALRPFGSAPVIEAFDGETVAVSAFATGETPFLMSMRDARCVQLEPCRIDVVIKSFD